jgi:NTE family protein
MADEQMNVDLVFEGGGVKGIGLGGAFQAIEEKGYRPHSVAGTSAGAITAALVAAGYSATDLKTIVSTMPFPKFMDKAGLSGLGLPGQFANVIKDLGIYEGRFFHQWIEEKLKDKGVTTFGDLYHDKVEDPAKPWKLRVIASDVTHRRMLVLPQDAKHLGIEPDDLKVADAVRMSMSIPIFFEPVAIKGGEGGPHTIVDGGMLSNFPVWLFDAPEGKTPRWPTFGLMLVEPEPRKPIGHRIAAESEAPKHESLIDFAKALALTMMSAHDRMYLDSETSARTIMIPTLGVGTTEFHITPDRVQALYDSGYAAGRDFLRDFKFEEYVATRMDSLPPE